MRDMRGVGGVALLLIGLSAAYLAYHEQSGILGNRDAFGYFLPSILYAARAVYDGGHGLLWNPYQACGVPLLATPQIGLLYPPHWLFFVLDPDVALRTVLVLDMTIAGLGTYLLCMEIGLGRAAALAGALLAAGGPTGAGLAKWSPMHIGTWAWLPVAMFCTERLLRQPSVARAVALAASLSMAIMPGFFQIVLFTYELVGLRVLWQLLTVPSSRRLDLIAYVLVGALLPLGLSAIQLVPTLELVRESVRGRDLPANEIREGAYKILDGLVKHARGRAIMGAPIDILALLLAPLALLRSPSVSAGRFYGIVFLLAWFLRFGPGTPLYDLYAYLPVVTIFQYPSRFSWVADYAATMLAAIGLANVARFGDTLTSSSRRNGVGAVIVVSALLTGAAWYVSWFAFELLVLLLATSALTFFFVRGRSTPAIALLLLALLVIEIFLRPPGPLRWAGSSDQYRARADTIGIVQRDASAMDRVLILPRRGFDVSQDLMLKSAMLYSLHGVADYEAVNTRRFAELFILMMLGRPPTGVWDVQLATSDPVITKATNRRLLDLLATRFIVSDPSRSKEVAELRPPLMRRTDATDLSIDVSSTSFPRAFVVPSVAVEPDTNQRLMRLANGPDDLRKVALLDASFPDGFTGSPGNAIGEATIVTNDPEHVSIEVSSPVRSFLVLTDQWYPGWEATVNGSPAPIVRANHAFRAVEVPAGNARVEFTFHHRSLWVGALVSVICVLVASAACWFQRTRPTVN